MFLPSESHSRNISQLVLLEAEGPLQLLLRLNGALQILILLFLLWGDL